MDIGKLFRDAWGLFVKDIGPLIVGMLIASIVPAVAAVGHRRRDHRREHQRPAPGRAGRRDRRGLDELGAAHHRRRSSSSWCVLFLSVPLYVGILSGVFRRVREGREMAYGDAFSGFGMFGKVIWAAVLLGLIFTAIIAVPTAVIVGGAVAGSGSSPVLGAVVLAGGDGRRTSYLGISWVYVFPVIVDRGLGVTEAMGESRRLVHGTGWWWTFLVLFVLQLVVGAVSVVLGLIPFVGAVATIVLYPFVLTYIVAMYFQARERGPARRRGARLAAAGAGRAAGLLGAGGAVRRTSGAAGAVPLRRAAGLRRRPSTRGRPTRRRRRLWRRRPIRPRRRRSAGSPAPQTAVTQPSAPRAPAQPAPPEAPPEPEPPASVPGA